MTVVDVGESVVGDELVSLVLTGGFPEMLFRVDEDRRQAWARDYLKTLLRRDIGDIAEVEKQEGMNRLFRILAHHSAQLVNFSQLGACPSRRRPPVAGLGPLPPFLRPNLLPSLTSGRSTPLLSTQGTAGAGSGPPYPPEDPVVRRDFGRSG